MKTTQFGKFFIPKLKPVHLDQRLRNLECFMKRIYLSFSSHAIASSRLSAEKKRISSFPERELNMSHRLMSDFHQFCSFAPIFYKHKSDPFWWRSLSCASRREIF